MIKFKHKGSFRNTERFFSNAKKMDMRRVLEKYGSRGVSSLASATPQDTGLTASSWDYTIEVNRGSCSITWTNSNAEYGVPVVVLIQYGHGTQNGAYIPGNDFINPAIKPILDQIAASLWEEVAKL